MRQPLLADLFVRSGENKLVQPHIVDKVKHRLKVARRFTFNDKALVRLGDVLREVPDLLFRESQFARAPYDVTWIAIENLPLLWKTIMGFEPDPDGDQNLGFLIDHDTVYIVSGSVLMPISYLLKTPWPDDERIAFAEKLNMTLFEVDAFCWGSAFNNIGLFSLADTMNDNHPVASLRKAHSLRLLPTTVAYTRANPRLLLGGAGELRYLIAILLLMNRPTLTTYVQDIPAARGFIKGKMSPYFSHTVVSIDLDPLPVVRRVGTAEGDGVPRRRHEVRGTWCRNYDAREYEKIGCVHEWKPNAEYLGEDDPNDPDHWVCWVCQGKLWWRRQMTRGDASKGYVQKTYDVTASTDFARKRRH